MSGITTHVLDTSRGRPATGVAVRLEKRESGGGWTEVGSARTDDDGRAGDLVPGEPEAGVFRLRFRVGAYFRDLDAESFYPYADVVFRVDDPGEHYHVPLLLSPFSYATYRGS